MKYYLINLIVVVTLLVSGCTSQKKLTYINDNKEKIVNYDLASTVTVKIKSEDELYIRVSSLDDVAYNFFSSQQTSSFSSFQNEQSISLMSYPVSDSGNIYFPILGSIYVKDMTVEEASVKLKNLLSEYFNQPSVLVRLVNKKVSVIGEVLRPGSYQYTQERINIFEALGLAGDVTIFGDKARVVVMRETNGKLEKMTLNLNSQDIFTSNGFYVQQDDVIYVEPQKTRKWSAMSTPWALTLTTISTLVLILSYFNLN
jgi:polysaccharide biosynthesis/export protein